MFIKFLMEVNKLRKIKSKNVSVSQLIFILYSAFSLNDCILQINLQIRNFGHEIL